MKTYIQLVLLVIGLTFTHSNVYAQTNGKAPPAINPFEEGIVRGVFTDAQIENLRGNIDVVKSQLSEALIEAKGKTRTVAIDIYLEAMKSSVVHSFKNAPKTGWLTRVALNQGLALTVGVPNADTNGYAKKGILQDISNEDLIPEILEKSIRLALEYYVEPKEQTNQSIRELPYMQYAKKHIALVRDWLDSVSERDAEYFAARSELENFLAVVAHESDLKIYAYSKEIVDVTDYLKNKYPETLPDTRLVCQVNRTLRGDLHKLQDALEGSSK